MGESSRKFDLAVGSSFFDKVRVCLLVPIHSLVQVLVVLLETSKLLPDKDSTTIVEMMSRQVL